MAVISVSAARLVERIEAFTAIAGENLDAGQVVRFAADGRVVRASADTAVNAAAVGVAIASATPGRAVTVLRHGILDLGDALNGQAYGAQIYLSNTAGALDTAPGTVSVTVGQVIAQPASGGTIQKLLRVHL